MWEREREKRGTEGGSEGAQEGERESGMGEEEAGGAVWSVSQIGHLSNRVAAQQQQQDKGDREEWRGACRSECTIPAT